MGSASTLKTMNSGIMAVTTGIMRASPERCAFDQPHWEHPPGRVGWPSGEQPDEHVGSGIAEVARRLRAAGQRRLHVPA